MYNDEYAASAADAAAKVGLLKKNPLGYPHVSLSRRLHRLRYSPVLYGKWYSRRYSYDENLTKIAMGLSFGIALSLVVIAGAEQNCSQAMPSSSTTAGVPRPSP